MASETPSRTPQSGDPLLLSDGRQFVLERADEDIRGWWFKATLQDGSSTLEGNLQLEWDASAGVWRPFAGRIPPPPSMQERRRQVRTKQPD